jgi:hypothetical protein
MHVNPTPATSRRSAAVAAWLFIAYSAAGCGARYTVRLSAEDIQQSIARRLPVSKSKLLVTVTVRAVSVEFMVDDDKILLRPQVDLSIAGQTALAGRALVEGEIRYAPETGEFFFDKPRVADVSIQGLPASARPVAEEVIGKLGEGYLTTTPLYRLKPTDFNQSLAKLVLKSVKVHHGRLEIELGT